MNHTRISLCAYTIYITWKTGEHTPGVRGIRFVHELVRSTNTTLRYVVDSADFTILLRQTGLIEEHLLSHQSRFEEAGYIEI
jgi:hypothetical protein